AVLNGDGTWSFVDQTSHSGDWEIKTRVVDLAGNSTEHSQDITLDAVAPDAPQSVSRSVDEVTVDLTDTNAKAGDMLFVTVGDQQFSRELTQGEIESGTFLIDVQGSTGGVESFIVDAAGNTSDIRLGAHTAVESFNLDPLWEINVGESSEFDFFTMRLFSDNPLDRTYATPGGDMVRVGATTNDTSFLTFELDRAASEVSFTVSGVNSANSFVEYRDDGDNLIARVPIPAGTGAQTIPFTPPSGVYISEVIFEILDGAGVDIDDFQYEVPDITVPHPANQSIEDAIQYLGTDENNIFSVDNVDHLDGTGSGIHAGAGRDTLKLDGENQVLDLTALGDKLTSIEVIDLTGSGSNTLKLSLEDVLNHGEADLFHISGKTQMTINGDGDDVVDLQGLMGAEDPGSWSAQGQISVGGKFYEVYSHSSLGAELLVEQGVTVNLV
ncbi:hypothetical protein, partial [Pseudomonas sp. TH31]|uniref:hypothetical protein n=1 Tax=Pseudomonas sp. TH31 TaxID=2796396 RepID=UPI0019113000